MPIMLPNRMNMKSVKTNGKNSRPLDPTLSWIIPAMNS